MLNFKKRPKHKKLEDFKLLEINLIKGLPIEYAYVMPKSDRVIQKENEESLMEVVRDNPYSAEYIKLGKGRGFELTGSVPELRDLFIKYKRKKALKELLFFLMYIIVFVLFIFVLGHPKKEFEENSFILVCCLILILEYISVRVYRIFKYRN